MKRENRVQVTPGVPQWWKSEGRAPWGGDGDHDCDDNGLEALWDIHLEMCSRELDIPMGTQKLSLGILLKRWLMEARRMVNLLEMGHRAE